MQVSGNVTTILGNSLLPSRDNNRLDEQPADRARRQTQEQQSPSQEQTVELSEAARQAAAQQQVIPVNRSESSQNGYQYYPTDKSESLTSSQQKALQAYDSTQQLGRESEGSGEFLSSVDIFV